MKKFISLLIFSNLFLGSYSQVIKGKILDKETKNPISFAVVYFDGTSVASYTDENGIFNLDIRKNSAMPLTISALGYYSTNISDFLSAKDIIVYLTPKVFEMKDVNVSAKGNPKIRKQNLAIFRKEFLGRTNNAKDCEIVNEDDIKFITSPDKDTLKAFSIKPIFIINKGLGYKITYYLNKFEYIKSGYLNQIIGNSLFDDDTTATTDKQSFEIKRNNTYFGSKMHFIRSLWNDELKSAGYIIKNLNQQLSYKDLVRNQLSTDPSQRKKVIYYSKSIPILFSVKWTTAKSESGMELLRNNILFDENGFYKGPGIIWHGEMAKQGIADLLPYDFQPSVRQQDKSLIDIRSVDSLSKIESDDQTAELAEKVYLHTDRDYYNLGDDIWFKAYVINDLTNVLSDSSRNLHVELISPSFEIIDSRTIRLDNGLGNGDFTLSDNLLSGTYRIRAYTNYMRNFGDKLFFNKDISIINSNDTASSTSDAINYINRSLEISFFPESGSLVDNVTSVVAFKAENATGSGCDVSGEVYSSAGDLITTFRSTHLGMGSFILKPLPGSNYYVTVKNSDGDLIRREIPKSFPKGFVLNASENQRNEHKIVLKTNPETLPDFIGKDLLLTISTHNKILKSLIIKPDSLNNSFILPTEDLSDGILMITLYSLDNYPLCERLIYLQNREDLDLKIETDKSIYKQRDSVSVKLSLIDDSGSEQEAFMSLSATESIYTKRTFTFPTTISSWFLLESDVRGKVEDPAYYFDPSNFNRLKDLDLLLLTQGWRDFEWKYKEAKYLPESGFSISGKVRKTFLDAPYVNIPVNIGIFQGEKNIITTVQTDSAGRFRLFLDNLAGSARLVVNVADKNGNFRGKVKLDSLGFVPARIQSNSSNDETSVSLTLNEVNNFSILLQTSEFRNNIKKKYSLSDTILIGEVNIYARRKETPRESHIKQSRIVYGQPDKEVIVTNELASLRTIKDLLVGRVAGVYPLGSGIRIRGYGSSLEGSDLPLCLLDGMVVSYGQVSSLPLFWIDRVDVIMSEKTAAFGVRGANGVISVITKTFDKLPYKAESYSINSTIYGYDTPRIFYSPKHTSKFQTGQLPDMRSTLYWFPDIKVVTNQDYLIKFYNADVSSTYKIIVEGMTSGGIPVTSRVEYEVK
ncbi:MAG: carboxypeptidase-like regulatory domain-containing protein [Bacteroidales bacterium]|nr:carboxypeptidase-like regulatory domain-containing protein [Bacteroidales bacterium]